MDEQSGKKRLFILAAVVLISSGLLAWSLTALFQADNDSYYGGAGEEYLSEDFPEDFIEEEPAAGKAPEVAPPARETPRRQSASPAAGDPKAENPKK